MKNLTHLSLLITLLFLVTSCAEKKTGSSTTTNTYVQNPIATGSTGGSSGSSSGSSNGSETDEPVCSNGICFNTALNEMIFSGPGTVGPIYWSSNTDLPPHISPNLFRTDALFSVRFKPIIANGTTSKQGRTCSQFTKNNFDKLRIQVMVRRSSDSLGEVKTLTASVDSYSSVATFSVPGGTSNPYILEVVSILSNHRCKSYYGSPIPGSGCPNAYFDIPVVSGNNPTECVAFKLEFATDNTYQF